MAVSEALSQRLSQLSAADKQRLLAHLQREKSRQQPRLQMRGDLDDWVGETHLADDIQPLAPAPLPRDPRDILLTGATGILGAHLLHDLCTHTDAVVWCLVRAQDEAEAARRLQANFASYYDKPLNFRRIRPLAGDMTQPLLGLAPSPYARPAQQGDSIVHKPAPLHHPAPFQQAQTGHI